MWNGGTLDGVMVCVMPDVMALGNLRKKHFKFERTTVDIARGPKASIGIFRVQAEGVG